MANSLESKFLTKNIESDFTYRASAVVLTAALVTFSHAAVIKTVNYETASNHMNVLNTTSNTFTYVQATAKWDDNILPLYKSTKLASVTKNTREKYQPIFLPVEESDTWS